jgi:hypothetical protein
MQGLAGLGLALAVACGGDGRSDLEDQGDTGIGVLSGTDGTGASGGYAPESKLDQGGGGGDGNGDERTELGCTKVDLLFVIDNSGSMLDEQANLVASFPGFISAMRDQLADTEGYHVGVTTSDLYQADFSCQREGALVTQTLGDGASNRSCTPYSSGGRYMTEQDDLAEAFACAAQVGISGDGDERPMQTMLAALSDDMTGAGGCNAGFLRDDALLVVVLITDEEDDFETEGCPGQTNAQPQPGSSGGPQQWYDELVAIKGGNEENVVVLSLVGPSSGQSCPPLAKCQGGVQGAEVAHRIIDFTERFTFGFVGPVCEPYGPFFSEAIGHIQSACDGFEPVG